MTKVITKNSTVPGKIPTTSDIVQGELAVNLADGKLYSRYGTEIKEIGGGSSSGVSEELAIMYAIILGGG